MSAATAIMKPSRVSSATALRVVDEDLEIIMDDSADIDPTRANRDAFDTGSRYDRRFLCRVGEYALLSEGELQDIFPTFGEALRAAQDLGLDEGSFLIDQICAPGHQASLGSTIYLR